MQAPHGINEVSALEALDRRCSWTGRDYILMSLQDPLLWVRCTCFDLDPWLQSCQGAASCVYSSDCRQGAFSEAPFTSSDPYALRPVERAEFPGTGRFRKGIWLHGGMDIQVAETVARGEGASPGRPAYMPTIVAT